MQKRRHVTSTCEKVRGWLIFTTQKAKQQRLTKEQRIQSQTLFKQYATIIDQFKVMSLAQASMKKQPSGKRQPVQKRKEVLYSSDQSQCDDSYVPRFMNSKRRKLQMKNSEQEGESSSNFNNSLWKLEENVAYMAFLNKNSHLFESNWHQRKSLKINVLMSKIIKTRSPAQCRSHHQKMMKYHQSIPNIIDHILNLQKLSPIPEATVEERVEFTPSTDIILQDLSDKWGWVEQYEDLWNKMMDQRWLQGTDEYYTIQ